jgi:hypothetical protein
MVTVLCVLRSGGPYSSDWVHRLRRAVNRNLTVAHQFVCISDVPVEADRIPLTADWPNWWAKIAMFAPGVLTQKTLYLDLDTIVTGNIDALADLPHDFAMLRGFGRPNYVGSGVMWFRERAPAGVYENFAADPQAIMDRYAVNTSKGAAFGDQAFIYDTVGDANIGRIQDDVPGLLRLYPAHFTDTVPDGCGLAVFKGKCKPPDAMKHPWAKRAWA